MSKKFKDYEGRVRLVAKAYSLDDDTFRKVLLKEIFAMNKEIIDAAYSDYQKLKKRREARNRT